jgi:hypothetical protein
MRSLFACCAVLLTTVGLIAAPAGGEGIIPRLVSTYEGTIYNTTFNIETTLEFNSVAENQGNISGKVVIGPGLGGSGPFTGTINTDGSVNFKVNSIFFKGSLRTDGSFGGTYSVPSVNQAGTWLTTPATSAQGEQPPGSEAIPVDQRFLGRYIGITEAGGQGSRMAIDIGRSDRRGYVHLKMNTWQDFKVEGNLIGEISPDGQLSATGRISEPPMVFRESRAWDCNVTGRIGETTTVFTFNGTYSCFPNTITGRNCPQIPGYPCPSTDAMQGSFDLEKFKRLVE